VRQEEMGVSGSPYRYLTISQIRELHDAVMQENRGAEGLRDLGRIVPSIGAPKDVFDRASAHARSIAQKKLFEDGNKRTALAAALVFLEINGVIDHDYYGPILQEALLLVSEGDITQKQFAQFLRDYFSETTSIWEPVWVC